MASRRDSVYKQLFSHPEIVRDLLVGLLPAEWARALTVDGLERVNASYASDHGKARHADVVWRARIGGEWMYVYILLEFQARPDKWMALRMQVYVGLLYQDLVAQHRLSKHGRLPPVLPIVLYHGRRPWRAATTLAQLMLPPPAGLERFQPGLQYVLVDQHHHGARGDIVHLLFRVLRCRTEPELWLAVEEFAMRMRQPDLKPIRETLRNWLQLTLQDELGETKMDLEEDDAMPAERKYKLNDVLTDEFLDRLLQPREEGLKEGLQAGIQQGMRQGERAALQRLLTDLLAGAGMPAPAGSMIAEADSSQLNDWIKALFEGASPRQLFAEG
jgi:predicted transposase/invertase (TIGR01784 family)